MVIQSTANIFGIILVSLWGIFICAIFNSIILALIVGALGYLIGPMMAIKLTPIALTFAAGSLILRRSRARRIQREAANTEHIDNLSGHQYEYLVADILSSSGWGTVVTPGSGDQGVDVVATKNGVRYAIQCKRQFAPVTNSAVQQVNTGRVLHGAEYSAVVTNSTFTKSARDAAQANGVILLHHNDLKYLERRVFSRRR